MQDLWQFHEQILLIISQNEFAKINVKIVIVFIENKSARDNLIKHKSLSCSKDYSNKADKELKKQFRNTFDFSNNNTNKFCCCS